MARGTREQLGQGSFWIVACDLLKPAVHSFYEQIDKGKLLAVPRLTFELCDLQNDSGEFDNLLGRLEGGERLSLVGLA